MPFSHHSHSGEFCAHAKGTLEEVVLTAIERGFRIYGLSEHCPRYREDDLYPEEQEAGLTPRLLHTRFASFLTEAHRLKAKYANRITLLVGLETEYIHPADLEGLSALLQFHGDQIEYMVGGLHHVRGTPIDFSRELWEECVRGLEEEDSRPTSEEEEEGSYSTQALSAFFSAYFDAQHTLITTVRPSVIAHIDLCRLYIPEVSFRDFPEVWERVERNVRAAIGYGALFEVNAAAFRKGWEEAYPAADILQLILRLGGRLTLSDDSHGPHAVGLNYPRLRTYLRSQGVTGQIWHLARKPSSQFPHPIHVPIADTPPSTEGDESPVEDEDIDSSMESIDAINCAILGDADDEQEDVVGGDAVRDGCRFWEKAGWEPSLYGVRVYAEWWELGFWEGELPET